MFGCYIQSKIDQYQYLENDEWQGGRIKDPNAFVFSLKSNGRQKYPVVCDIFEESSDWAFMLFKSDMETLFSVGGGCDITIAKQNVCDTCFCVQHSFNYQNMKDLLVGRTGDNNFFTIQRIQVLQMMKTNVINYSLKHNEDLQLHQLNSSKSSVLNEISPKCVTFIEQQTTLKINEIIFDSQICDWKMNTSTFDYRIFCRSNICILMIDEEMNIFGCFISQMIDKLNLFISDKNAFVFVYQNEEFKKCEINEKHFDEVFILHDQESDVLFQLGNDDIIIGKEECISLWNEGKENSFNFNEKNVKQKFGERKIKRILVLQLQ